jgi:geranylgeranyl reductase family protein
VSRFDAVVVGAGPAGSLTAYHLARGGASVLLLDRAKFPRDKPCGGGLTGRALRHLPFSVDPVVEHVVDRFEFRFRYRLGFVRRGRGPLVLMTQRRRLDAYLAERAVETGADFRDGTRVTGVEIGTDGATVTVSGRPIEGRVVVGADGANGITARSVGLGGGYRRGVAFEGNCGYGDVDAQRYAGLALVELGVTAGGYGWIFPKADHANVGIGGWEEEGPMLRGRLAEFCDAHRIPVGRLRDLRGHRLPLRRGDGATRGRAILVGDAAGLVDPISGDGLYEAFVSARLAADAVLGLLAGSAGDLSGYDAALSRALDSQAAASWAAKTALERFPRATFGLLRVPPVWPVLEALLRGEIEHPGEARGVARPPLRLIRTLGSARLLALGR